MIHDMIQMRIYLMQQMHIIPAKHCKHVIDAPSLDFSDESRGMMLLY